MYHNPFGRQSQEPGELPPRRETREKRVKIPEFGKILRSLACFAE